MIAIDTNVVVRFIVIDDPDQSARAKALLESAPVSASLTVLLEAGWVLASRYRYPPKQVVVSIRHFLGLPNVSVEDAWMVDKALGWVADGLDFADALHLAQVRDREGFATFDRDLARLGSRLADLPIRLL